MTQLVTKGHTILIGDVLDRLKELPDESIHLIVTSPPYFGLRSYIEDKWVDGNDPACDHSPARAKGDSSSTLEGGSTANNHAQEGFKGDTCPKCGATAIRLQIGLEKTPDEYIKRLVDVFREARRVLHKDGSFYLNLGDSYWGSWGNSGNRPQLDGESQGQRERVTEYQDRPGYDNHRERPASSYKVDGLKPKDLIGIPWMAAFALRSDGWWLREEIIWAKRVPMPESIKDRCTRSHEHIFHFTKSQTYFYDAEAIKEKIGESMQRYVDKGNYYQKEDSKHDAKNRMSGGEKTTGNTAGTNSNRALGDADALERIAGGRNKRDVWTLSTYPSSLGHHAMFPPHIPLTCIQAGTSSKGCCSKCGAPWARLMEQTDEPDPSLKGSTFDGGKTGVNQKGRAQKGERKLKRELGWGPSCDCGAGEPVPCTVLDLFHGSGTTGAVAEYLGRRYIGIELNPAYVELYDARVAEVKRVIVGGDAPDRGGVAESQPSLFGE